MIRALLIPALLLLIFAVAPGTSRQSSRESADRSSVTDQRQSPQGHETLSVAGATTVDCAILSAGGQSIPDGPLGVIGQLAIGLVLNGPTGANQGALPCWFTQVGGYALTRYVFGGGAVVTQSGAFSFRATVGEPIVGAVSNGGFVLTAGYWPPLSTLGDCDADGTANLGDYQEFAPCFGGPGGPPVSSECACYDLNVDRRVDLRDFRNFQNAFTGSSP